jgi:hypothetical protein
MTTCNDEITIPGCWECPQCGFLLNKSELCTESETVDPSDGLFVERCPNDSQILIPETWKARCRRLSASCEQLLAKVEWLNGFCSFKPN